MSHEHFSASGRNFEDPDFFCRDPKEFSVIGQTLSHYKAVGHGGT